MCTLKRYLVFKFYWYYPEGGWDDFTCSYDKKEDAIADARQLEMYQASQVVDARDGKIIAFFSRCQQEYLEEIKPDKTIYYKL